ncbi:hypothetical protein HYN24_09210 [Dechloromonas sp. HYN0024]|nr:hypothetical protein HYN24_09210 [Dechloromonas sp. HYN0024]
MLEPKTGNSTSSIHVVANTVPPAIPKDGAYVMGEAKVVIVDMCEDKVLLKPMTGSQTEPSHRP